MGNWEPGGLELLGEGHGLLDRQGHAALAHEPERIEVGGDVPEDTVRSALHDKALRVKHAVRPERRLAELFELLL